MHGAPFSIEIIHKTYAGIYLPELIGSQCFWYYDGLKQYRLTGGHARFWTTVISWFGKNYHKTHLYENLKGEFSYDSLEPPKQK